MRTITGPMPISVATLRDFLHIDTTADDAQLTRCIAAAVDHIETETQRDILLGDVVQQWECGAAEIILDRSPVIEVLAIEIGGVPFAGTWRLVKKDSTRAKLKIDGTIPTGLLEVGYETGMATPSPRVIQVCLWAAAHFYLNREPELVGSSINQFTHGMERLINGLKAGGYA